MQAEVKGKSEPWVGDGHTLRVNVGGATGSGKSALIEQLLSASKVVKGSVDAESEPDETAAAVHRSWRTPHHQWLFTEVPAHEGALHAAFTAAAHADFAVVVVDAREGLVSETRRHTHLSSVLGVELLLLLVNKLDLVDDPQAVFAGVEAQFRSFASRCGIESVRCLPTCALDLDSLAGCCAALAWHSGPNLAELLDQLALDAAGRYARRALAAPFRLVVSRSQPQGDAAEVDGNQVAGRVVSGEVSPDVRLRIQPSGRLSRVTRVLKQGQEVAVARAGQVVTLTLQDSVDLSAADVLSAADQPALVADQFEATVVWMHQAPLLRGRSYSLQIGARSVGATIAPLKYKIEVDSLARVVAPSLQLGEIGVCNLQLDRPVVFDAYAHNHATGSFVLKDGLTHETVGAGILHFALWRSANVHWQAIDVNKQARAELKGQKPCVLWFTGLSGAGKSAIANLVDKQLHALGCHTYLLDGDNVRHGLNKDLGFTAADRVENIRRIAEVAKLMVDAGLIVSTAFISPFRAERQMARSLFPPAEFIEIFVDTPLSVAEARDPKGLYKKARRGELKNFTGIDSPYEPPERPDLRIDTTAISAEASANAVVAMLRARGAVRVE